MAHDRTLDHYGTEDTTTTVLSASIGRYPEGMSLQDVLADMVGRIVNLENNVCGLVREFTANAVIGRYFTAYAVIRWIGSDNLLFDAVIGRTFSANAVIRGTASNAATTFTANSVFVDNVECE